MPLVISGVLFCDPKISSPQIRFLFPAGFERVKSGATLVIIENLLAHDGLTDYVRAHWLSPDNSQNR